MNEFVVMIMEVGKKVGLNLEVIIVFNLCMEMEEYYYNVKNFKF